MLADGCSFETERLLVWPWHRPAPEGWPQPDLVTTVTEIMTEPVTRFLPTGWRGGYSADRARAWIAERDDESPTLLVVLRSTRQPIGFVILFEAPAGQRDQVTIRTGYLLAEPVWGTGLATELLQGLIRWCRQHHRISSIVGGVAQGNEASRRALERLGFSPIDPGRAASDDELVYELRLDGAGSPRKHPS